MTGPSNIAVGLSSDGLTSSHVISQTITSMAVKLIPDQCMTGLSNIVTALSGAGLTGSYIFSQTIFSMRAGVRSRLHGCIIAGVLTTVVCIRTARARFVKLCMTDAQHLSRVAHSSSKFADALVKGSVYAAGMPAQAV